GHKFMGSVIQLNPYSDPQSHQSMMRVSLNNMQNLIKPGMFARVVLELERAVGAVAVPREAVQNGKNGAFATVIDSENKAHRRPIVLGASDTEGYAIKSGLEAGEQVVVLSAAPIRDGTDVRIGSAQESTP